MQSNNERDRNEVNPRMQFMLNCYRFIKLINFLFKWIRSLQCTIKDDNRAKIQNYMNTNSARNIPNANAEIRQFIEPNVQFELGDRFKKDKNLNQVTMKPQLGDLFKVRYLGSMNVKADKGNEYIHDTIRQVMAARAKKNIFKMNEYNLIINSDSLSLFSVPENAETEKSLSALSSEDLLKARFDLADLAFWASHKENQRLFGYIIKEPFHALKFCCLVFESDVNSAQICESITNATQLAFQLLIVILNNF